MIFAKIKAQKYKTKRKQKKQQAQNAHKQTIFEAVRIMLEKSTKKRKLGMKLEQCLIQLKMASRVDLHGKVNRRSINL